MPGYSPRSFVFGDDANAERLTARRLVLVPAEQMIAAMVGAIERPASGVRVLGVPEIRGR